MNPQECLDSQFEDSAQALAEMLEAAEELIESRKESNDN